MLFIFLFIISFYNEWTSCKWALRKCHVTLFTNCYTVDLSPKLEYDIVKNKLVSSMKANYTYWQWQVPKCLKRQPEQRSPIKSVSKGIEASATDSTHILKLNKLKQMKLVIIHISVIQTCLKVHFYICLAQ